LLDITASGSYSKGTTNRGDTDLDLFISLFADTPDTLANVPKNLVNVLTALGSKLRLQNGIDRCMRFAEFMALPH
jgi:tRNA nucleotidyltransferase (CCA-adding enzyme)